MQPKRNTTGLLHALVGALAIALLAGPTPLRAATPDDLAKEITKKFSSIQRRIVTDPSRAETEMIETHRLLAQLKEASPDDAKLPALQKRADDLAKKLEKRLGRPIGGAAKKEESKPAPTPAKAPPSNLPSSVVSRLKRMDAALQAVAGALEKNRLQTAKSKLAEANRLMDEIQKRYAKSIPPGNEDMKAAAARLETITKQFAQAESAATATAAAEAQIKQQKEAQSQEWIAKLRPFTNPRDDLYLRIGADFNRGTEAEQKQYRQAYAQANNLMAAYKKTKFPHGKTPELAGLEFRVNSNLAMFNADQARAKQEEACRPWVEKLGAYVDVGAGSRKYLIVGVTFDETQINEQAALLAEAKALWPEYQKAEFPHGKSLRLLDLEKEMQQRLEEMPEILRQSRALVSGDIEKEFDRVLAHLNKDTDWQSDETKKPNIAMARDIEPLHKALQRYAGTVQPDDAQLAKLKDKLAQIEQQDQKNRAIRADRTYMMPDRFAGDNVAELRQKAEEIIKDKSATGKALRVTLPAANWQEENVLEWTDTSRTVVRYRTTRFMTAQAAAKAPDGKVYLHGVHLANDRQSDGSWGPLHGHIMWSDWMAEKNVDKEPPTK